MRAGLTPVAHPGWSAFRIGFALCALLTWIPRGYRLTENYGSAGAVLERSALPLAHWVVYSDTTVWAIWGTLVASHLVLLTGRANRPALLIGLLATWSLNFHEGLNFKAYDRLMFWQATMLLLAPGGGDGTRVASQGARYALMLAYCGIYGSTGWMKVLAEPTWSNGEVLRWALSDSNFGQRPLGLLLQAYPSIIAPAGWLAVGFEASFPFLIWFAPPRRWLLAAGVVMHLGILATMHVNTFSLVAIAAYPVLLDGEQWAGVARWLGWPGAPPSPSAGVTRAIRLGIAAVTLAFVVGWAAPVIAEQTYGPRTDAAWRPPSPTIRAALRNDVDALTQSPRASAEELATAVAYVGSRLTGSGWSVDAADGAWTASGATPARVQLCAHLDTRADVPGADDNASGVAAVLGVADALSPADAVALTLYSGPICPSRAALLVVVDQVGRYGYHSGTQAWSSRWTWVLTHRGDFLGVAGPGADAVAQSLRAASPLPVLRLPGGAADVRQWRTHKADLRPTEPDVEPAAMAGAVLVTDTGRLRNPATNSPRDHADSLDFDNLSYVVEGLIALCASTPPGAAP